MSKYIDADRLREKIEKYLIYDSNIDVAFFIGRSDAERSILTLIDSLQKEQPEVDLEKLTEKITAFQERYKHPESISIKGSMAFMARMFYQYPNAARLWYEQLPKATMD